MSRPLDTHEERWIVRSIQLDRSRLSERALLNRSLRTPPRADLRVTFVAQTWYLAREIAAIYFGLNIDAIEVSREPSMLLTTAAPLDVRREHGDLVVTVPGFFDVENEPPEDEYAPVPTCGWTDEHGECSCIAPGDPKCFVLDEHLETTFYCPEHHARGVKMGLWS